MFCNLNGNIIHEKKAAISINNRSFRYGDGCFETIKYANSAILMADFHFQRLFATLQTLHFDYPTFFTPQYLAGQIHQLVAANKHQALARIRLHIFAGDGGLYDAPNRHANWLLQSWSLNPTHNELNINGLVVALYKGGFKAADAFANLKTNNFLLYSQAAYFAKQQQANDALVFNHLGSLADATIDNLFLITHGNTILTPPLSDGPVAGTMRQYLLQALPALGFTVLEQSISEQDLYQAQEVFLSNAMGIRWVQNIGNHQFTNQTIQRIYGQLMVPLWAGQ